MLRKTFLAMAIATAAASLFFTVPDLIRAASSPVAAVRIDNDDIGGVVTSANGPEAGVWVIAETTGLPTKFTKIVVTDDQGRYVIPDLPKANYSVWVRGYGVVDSPKVKAAPGKIVNLKAVVAPSPAAATGRHCPEGWTLYPFPGPQFDSVKEPGSAESSYCTWVDQFDTFGLGKDVPMATGNLNDGILALVDGKFVTLRVPYPMGYYIKGMDGHIDDPKAGWKGRGLWSTTSTRAPFHMEGGKGTLPKVVKFQLRPDPLAK